MNRNLTAAVTVTDTERIARIIRHHRFTWSRARQQVVCVGCGRFFDEGESKAAHVAQEIVAALNRGAA